MCVGARLLPVQQEDNISTSAAAPFVPELQSTTATPLIPVECLQRVNESALLAESGRHTTDVDDHGSAVDLAGPQTPGLVLFDDLLATGDLTRGVARGRRLRSGCILDSVRKT